MTEDDAAKIMNELVEKMTAEAFGVPPVPNRLTALRYVGGRFETVEIDDDGKIIEPPIPCPRCRVILCAEHMAQIT